MRIVVGLDDNALVPNGDGLDSDPPRRKFEVAAAALAQLVDHQLIVVCDGAVGYLLEQELAGVLPEARLATILTQVVVDPGDRSFRRPTRPIGPRHPEAVARQLAAVQGWLFEPDGSGGLGYRRVLPSPEPQRILELETIRLLVEAGVLVICAAGGGIPVAVDAAGTVQGLEAIVERDLSAALMAILLDADRLLLLTDTTAVCIDAETAQARELCRVGPTALRSLGLDRVNTGIKVEAACRFVEATGHSAAIGPVANASGVLAGEDGTTVTISEPGLRWRPDRSPAKRTWADN